jgi:hypothetical protein
MGMEDSRRIVICGNSIYMLAIESGIAAISEGDVVRIDPGLPNTIERISVLDPHVVIIEQDRKNNQLALEVLSKSIPLIVLDESRRSMILVRELAPKAEIGELTCVIEKINHQQVETIELITNFNRRSEDAK